MGGESALGVEAEYAIGCCRPRVGLGPDGRERKSTRGVADRARDRIERDSG